MILDTDFFIDFMDGKEDALRKMDELNERNESWGIASPTLVELWSGVVRSDNPEGEKKKVQKVLGSNLVVDLESHAAMRAGLIHGTLMNEGESIGAMDSLIAGIAIANNETLLTRNEKHFSRIKGLELETY